MATNPEGSPDVEKALDKDELLKCQCCGKDLESFFMLGATFCPYCGSKINESCEEVHRPSSVLEPAPPPPQVPGRATWTVKWSLLAVPIGIGLLLGGTFVVAFIILAVLIGMQGVSALSDINGILQQFQAILLNPTTTGLLSFLEIVLVITPLVVLRRSRRTIGDRLQLLGWRPYITRGARTSIDARRLGIDIAIGLLFGLGFVGMQFLLSFLDATIWGSPTPITDAFFSSDPSITPTGPGQLLLLVGTMILVIGPVEEFLFRGFTQHGLETKYSPMKAMFITALLFTAVHVMNVFSLGGLLSSAYMVFPYFVLSIALCTVYMKTKNLNQMIFIHGIYDSLLVVYSYLLFLGSSAVIEFAVVSIVAFGIVVGWIVVLFRHKLR
jgi:membrane protease YdiL (CAAX protease family)